MSSKPLQTNPIPTIFADFRAQSRDFLGTFIQNRALAQYEWVFDLMEENDKLQDEIRSMKRLHSLELNRKDAKIRSLEIEHCEEVRKLNFEKKKIEAKNELELFDLTLKHNAELEKTVKVFVKRENDGFIKWFKDYLKAIELRSQMGQLLEHDFIENYNEYSIEELEKRNVIAECTVGTDLLQLTGKIDQLLIDEYQQECESMEISDAEITPPEPEKEEFDALDKDSNDDDSQIINSPPETIATKKPIINDTKIAKPLTTTIVAVDDANENSGEEELPMEHSPMMEYNQEPHLTPSQQKKEVTFKMPVEPSAKSVSNAPKAFFSKENNGKPEKSSKPKKNFFIDDDSFPINDSEEPEEYNFDFNYSNMETPAGGVENGVNPKITQSYDGNEEAFKYIASPNDSGDFNFNFNDTENDNDDGFKFNFDDDNKDDDTSFNFN